MISPDRDTFRALASPGVIVPLHQRVMGDHLTPVLAYRRLVAPDERTAPSFLFESVETGGRAGRHSILGARPSVEVIAFGHEVTIIDHAADTTITRRVENPLGVMEELLGLWTLVRSHQPSAVSRQSEASRRGDQGVEVSRHQGSAKPGTGNPAFGTPRSPVVSSRPFPSLPDAFLGGWVGYAGYDTVRYLEGEKIPFAAAPPDDRGLPDLHFALYPSVVVFDHVERIVHVVHHAMIRAGEDPDAVYERETTVLWNLVKELETERVRLPAGSIDLDLAAPPAPPGAGAGNFTRAGFEDAVRRAKHYIAAGDAFQVVLSQRFERRTSADPFDIYRALRVVNPSPYMIYLQAKGAILVASSPEILCRVRGGVVTNRPLAGTRRRGGTPEEDAALERDLLADDKERAEHIMLVDLARNDLGVVCEVGSIAVERIMDIERYSHVMHISSTVTGRLRQGLTCWDALRSTLPVGTVSGAPKVRAMQIIDELEPTRRGPYGGGIGGVGFDGSMDIALTLRTMVIPTGGVEAAGRQLSTVSRETAAEGRQPTPRWTVHLQAGAGIVADSDPASEYQETVNKAAALGRAIDLAESAFGR